VPPPDAPRGTLQYGEPALTRDAGKMQGMSQRLALLDALHYPTKRRRRNDLRNVGVETTNSKVACVYMTSTELKIEEPVVDMLLC